MNVSVNWLTKTITIPKSELVQVQATPNEIYQLDLQAFRLALLDIQDSPDGIVYPDTHRHNTTVTVGGVTLARVIEIINDYMIEFEDGQYAVNLIGANSNVADRVVVNQVSVRSANSAGLVQSTAALTQTDIDNVSNAVWANAFVKKLLTVAKFLGLK